MDSELRNERIRVLLVEYQKAQDSAEHHDNLVGNVTSLWLGSAVLIGFVLTAIESGTAPRYRTVLIIVIVVGFLLTVLVYFWAKRANKLKNQKYKRCKAIERTLGMRQHLDVDGGRTAKWMFAYALLMALFALAWIALFVNVAFPSWSLDWHGLWLALAFWTNRL